VPISSVVKNFRDGTITVSDGTTPTPLAVIVQYEAGDFSITGLTQGNLETTTYLDRGDLGSVRSTSRTFPTFSFTCHMTDLSDGTNKTIWDIVNKSAGSAFASAVSTLTGSDVYALTVVLAVEGTNFGDATDHTLTLSNCRLSIDFSEGDPNSFSLNGTVYGSIVAV
jgi:hypothetical protein